MIVVLWGLLVVINVIYIIRSIGRWRHIRRCNRWIKEAEDYLQKKQTKNASVCLERAKEALRSARGNHEEKEA